MFWNYGIYIPSSRGYMYNVANGDCLQDWADYSLLCIKFLTVKTSNKSTTRKMTDWLIDIKIDRQTDRQTEIQMFKCLTLWLVYSNLKSWFCWKLSPFYTNGVCVLPELSHFLEERLQLLRGCLLKFSTCIRFACISVISNLVHLHCHFLAFKFLTKNVLTLHPFLCTFSSVFHPKRCMHSVFFTYMLQDSPLSLSLNWWGG
jgi:hypothetical protein